jgi:hypothetical protein
LLTHELLLRAGRLLTLNGGEGPLRDRYRAAVAAS